MLDIRQLLKTDLVSVDEGVAEDESELVQDVVVVGGEDDASHVLAGDQHPVEAADLVSYLAGLKSGGHTVKIKISVRLSILYFSAD